MYSVIVDFVDAFVVADTYCYLLKLPFDTPSGIHRVAIDAIGIVFWLIVEIILEISVLRTLLRFEDGGKFNGVVIRAFVIDMVIMMISFLLLTFIILKTFYTKRYLENVNSSNAAVISNQQKYYMVKYPYGMPLNVCRGK